MTPATTGTTGAATAPDLNSIRAAIERLAAEEPIGKWMRSQGFDPADGCILVLPGAPHQPFTPAYVRYSEHVHAPLLLRGDVPSMLTAAAASRFPL